MDTIHPPSGSRHHHSSCKLKSPPFSSASLRPFSNQLKAYTAYATAVRRLRSSSPSVDIMVHALKHDRQFRKARAAARLELQRIYDHVALGLRLPKLPVRLPLRKSVRKGGMAMVRANAPWEIRLYPFGAMTRKNRREWLPADVGVVRPSGMCEVLLHEVAHIHQGVFTGEWDHEHGFVRSYGIVERVFLGLGFGPLLPDKFRFSGCPPNSEGAKLEGTARPPQLCSRGLAAPAAL